MNTITPHWLRLARSLPVMALIIFSLALLPRILNLAVFVGPDEFSWVTRSANFAQALTRAGDLTETYQTEHPAVTLMWVGTAEIWWRYLTQTGHQPADWTTVINTPKTMAILAGERTAAVLVNTLLLVAGVLLIARVFGNGVAWLTGFLLAFDPFLLTETRALRTEGIVTSFSTAACLSFLMCWVNPRLRWTTLAGLLTGLALLSKISAVALLPVGALVMGLAPFFNNLKVGRKRWQQAGYNLLVWGGVTLLTIITLWPALWVAPMMVVQRMFGYMYIRGIEGGGGSSESFFLGQPLPDNSDPGWLFYPVVLAFRTTPLVWLGILLLILLILLRRHLARRQLVLIGLLGLYLLSYLVVITRSELKFDRYIIPMLPALTVIAALGLANCWQWLVRHFPVIQKFSWLAILAILTGQMALAMPHHPYYYTYWNPLLGGLKQAVKVLPVGVGHEGIDQVATYLNTLPGAEQLKVASANSQKIRPLFKGQTIAMDNQDGKWVQANLAFIYISQLQRAKHDPNIVDYLKRHLPLHTVTLHGLEYAWVYPAPAAQYYGGGQKLEGHGTLYGYSLNPNPEVGGEQPVSPERGGAREKVLAGDTMPVILYWRNEGQQPDDRFFVRLVDADGYIWAEAIAQPRPGFEAASRQENSIVESQAALTLPVGMPPGDYFFKSGFRTTNGSIIGYFELPADAKPIQVTTAKSYPTLDTFQPPYPVRLIANGDLVLLGYQLSDTTTQPDAKVWLTLFWQATTAVEHDYVILVRLLDKTGQELSYWLGRPVRSGYPTTEWQVGQIVQDPWQLTIPAAAQPGDYQIEIAIFEAATQNEVIRQKIGPLTINSK